METLGTNLNEILIEIHTFYHSRKSIWNVLKIVSILSRPQFNHIPDIMPVEDFRFTEDCFRSRIEKISSYKEYV